MPAKPSISSSIIIDSAIVCDVCKVRIYADFSKLNIVVIVVQHFVLYTDREDVRKPADEASTLAEAGVADLQTNGNDYKPPS